MLGFAAGLVCLLLTPSAGAFVLAGGSTPMRHTNAAAATFLAAAANEAQPQNDLFKAGLLANVEQEAAALAAKKIRSVKDLKWTKPPKRRGNTRPRHWAFGGANEKPVQLKPNYDETSPNAVEPWLSLQDFYQIVQDDTAVADTIFVALAKGGAFVERDVAESVVAQWRPQGNKFDVAAFEKTVTAGRLQFLQGWVLFLTITGIAITGIIFPTNPLQLFFVDLLEQALGNDAKLQALADLKNVT